MAKEEKTEDTEEEGGGGKKKKLMIIGGAVLLIGIAVGATLFLMGGDAVTEEGATTEVVEEVEPKGDPVYIKIDPAFTVNLEPEDPVHFLQISVQILTYYEEVGEELTKHMPLIKNNLFTLFGMQKSAILRTPEGKEALQKEVLKAVQEIIDKYGNGGEVENVFFTNFVMQ